MLGLGTKVYISHYGNFYDGFDGEVVAEYPDAVQVRFDYDSSDWDEVMFMREQVLVKD